MSNAHSGSGTLPGLVAGKEIARWLGSSRQSVDSLVQRGQFPDPIRIGRRRKAWVRADVLSWLKGRRTAVSCSCKSSKPSDGENLLALERGAR
jgi:predicted DNA-binding transcriptional regulator AlpA